MPTSVILPELLIPQYPRGLVPFVRPRGAAWTPAALPNLALWMDASRITGSDNDQVGGVTDYGTLSAAISRTPSAAVILRTAYLNGRNVLLFDGTGLLSVTGASYLAATNNAAGITVAALVNHAVNNDTRGLYFVSTNTSGNSRVSIQRASSGLRTVGRHLDADAATTVNSGTAIISTSTWYRDITRINFAAGTMTRWLNGTKIHDAVAFGSAGNTSATNAAASQIGASAGSSFFSGLYATLAVYSDAKSDTEVDYLDRYLTSFWGV